MRNRGLHPAKSVLALQLWRLLACITHKRPPIDLFVVYRVDLVVILKNIAFLLFSAHHIAKLILILLQGVAGFWHLNSSLCNSVPINTVEEGMTFNFVCAVCTSAQTFGGVTIQQVNYYALGFCRHGYWQLQRPPLDIIEKLGPIENKHTHALNFGSNMIDCETYFESLK